MKKAAIAGILAATTLLSSGLTASAQASTEALTENASQQESSAIVSLPKTTGSYQVGTTNFDWVDSSRKDLFTSDPNDYRELMVQVWYPIDNGKGKIKETYIPSPVKGIESLAKSLGMGEQFAAINNIDTDTYRDAILSNREAKYPIVLFSHGFGRARWEYQSITRELASHGFIVFSVDHTHLGFGTEFKDGRFVPFSPVNMAVDFKKMDENINQLWVKDLQFVIRQLDKINKVPGTPNFENRLDLDNIAAVGHSFGGAAAARALQVEPRIKAAINMDGSFVGLSVSSGKMNKPFAFIKTEAHAKDLEGEPVLPPMPPGVDAQQVLDQYKEYAARYKKAVEGDAYDITIAGTTQNEHMSFTDHPLLKSYYLEGSPFVIRDPKSDPNDFYKLTNSLILSFLEKHLIGKTNTLFDVKIEK
ncbi:alpha/beta hydrolase family protein [Paenibacillus thermotolerans]|uniref:alpha/beta hydrolase family protein n=1 Tax=Paenibacillus thermotolerans TaxID=3027807 RepID=UPI002367A5AF|nr:MULTISPECIES: alpha/beta fold hydrolase [unclassified Paenibacillus]